MAPLLTGRLGLAGVVDAMARAGAIDGAEAGGGKGLDIVPSGPPQMLLALLST